MIIKTRAIIFRVVKFGETSVICDAYTEERGLQSYVMNSVRTAKPKFHAGLLQVMSLLDMVAYAREGKELNHVKECRAAYPFQQIPFDIKRGAIGTFMIELAQKSIKESESNPDLFHFLFESFVFLDTTSQPTTNIHLSFMVKLCYFLGILPEYHLKDEMVYFDLREGIFSESLPNHPNFMGSDISQILRQFVDTNFEDNHTISLNTETRRQFLQQMIKYYELHIPNFSEMKTFTILQSVLS